MLKVKEFDIFQKKIFDIDAIRLIKCNNFLKKHISFCKLPFVFSRFYWLPFQDFNQNCRKFRLNYVILIGLIATIHHPNHALNDRFHNIHNTYCNLKILNKILYTEEWSRRTIM